MAQTLDDGGVIRVGGRDDAVADEEVDDHQVGVEHELPGLGHGPCDPFDGPEGERLDLAVGVLGREIRRKFDIEDEDDSSLRPCGCSVR